MTFRIASNLICSHTTGLIMLVPFVLFLIVVAPGLLVHIIAFIDV